MQRRHLFEFGDQDWLPSRFRQQLTDLLAHQVERGRLYHPIVPMLAQALAKSGSKRVLDLCSGGGTSIGILQAVEQELGRELQIRLTDKFPTVTLQHRAAARERHVAEAESIDASSVPAHLLGFRTMFTAFHHFKPAQCQEILGDAVRAAQPIAIFEFTQRSAKFLVLGALVGFPVVLPSCLTLRPWTL